jgi:hypothetical protein
MSEREREQKFFALFFFFQQIKIACAEIEQMKAKVFDITCDDVKAEAKALTS